MMNFIRELFLRQFYYLPHHEFSCLFAQEKWAAAKTNRRVYINVLSQKDENLKINTLGIITKVGSCL